MELAITEREGLLKTLKVRFERNMSRHPGFEWGKIQQRLEVYPNKLWSLGEMEITGGQPDIIAYDAKADEYIFYDCAAESPMGRRSVCYDREGQLVREAEGIHPNGNVIDIASAMGIELLTEAEYRGLQKLGKFDTKSSSWIKTPDDIRNHGGAIFADFRYGHIFVYHNSAQTFYAARGFRASLRV